jgi:hypothetical protein
MRTWIRERMTSGLMTIILAQYFWDGRQLNHKNVSSYIKEISDYLPSVTSHKLREGSSYRSNSACGLYQKVIDISPTEKMIIETGLRKKRPSRGREPCRQFLLPLKMTFKTLNPGEQVSSTNNPIKISREWYSMDLLVPTRKDVLSAQDLETCGE